VAQVGIGGVAVEALRGNFNADVSNHRWTNSGRPLPGGRRSGKCR
jgi:hypothetical protein